MTVDAVKADHTNYMTQQGHIQNPVHFARWNPLTHSYYNSRLFHVDIVT